MFSPIPLNNRKVPVFLMTKVIWQGSTTTSPPPRLHSLCKFISVRYVNSRKNSFHQLAHRVHRGKERRQCDIFCCPRTKTTKIHWEPSLHTSPSNDTLATLPREPKRAPCFILDIEFNFLRQYFVKNGYPLGLVNSHIKKFLAKKYESFDQHDPY